MNLNSVLAAVGKMFPSINLSGAVQNAQEIVSQTPNSLDGVSAAAKNMGITQKGIDSIFDKYGNTMQAKAICSLLGTTPEALKADADMIVGGGQKPISPSPKVPQSGTRFPRLK